MATGDVISVEEIHTRRRFTKSAGPSESSPLKLNNGPEEWLDLVMSATRTKSPRIPKVPQMRRETKDFGKHYDARVISIGPYHIGKPNLKNLENHKSRIATKFVDGNRDTLRNLFYDVLELSRDSHLCTWYEQSCNKSLSDEAFAWMMVLDGCFILYYIECVMNCKEEDLEMNTQDVALVQQDLFLLENQLPFCVLKVLMGARTSYWEKEMYMSKITTFIKENIWSPPNLENERNCGTNGICQDMAELFKKLKQCFKTPKRRTRNKMIMRKGNDHCNEDPERKRSVSNHTPQAAQDPEHLLQHLQKQIVGSEGTNVQQDTKGQSTLCYKKDKKRQLAGKQQYTFRNVDELLGIGIHCRRSQSTNLSTAVKYNNEGKFRTYLELPAMVVDDSTKAMFLNLIAYEMYSVSAHKSWVTSYVCFLDKLIDQAQDVKILRSAGILENWLGSDSEVSQLFNDIGHDLVPCAKHYATDKEKIQKHYKIRSKTWIAQLERDYFKNPWSIFALLGAILVVLLTGVQTFFSIRPLPSDCDGLCKNIQRTHHL